MSFSDWLAARFRYRRFARSGHNIARRYATLRPYWEPHIEASRKLQREWNVSGHRLLVLGPGRLLDFAPELAERFQEVFFLDADPTASSAWRNLAKRLKGGTTMDYEVREITLKYDPWQMHLAERLSATAHGRRWDAALVILRDMLAVPPPRLPRADAVLSLNILSQLPIGWQEIVEELLQEAFGKPFVKDHEQEWLEALLPSGARLVEDHFSAIASTRCKQALLLTDTIYSQYQGVPPFSPATYSPPPDSGEHTTWSALCNVDIETMLPGWQRRKLAEWTWHIAPLGLEDAKMGTFHNVAGYLFESPA